MLEKLQHAKKVIGIKETKKALKQGEVTVLYIAKDAAKNVVEPIEELAKEQNIAIVPVDSMKKLGQACGIDVAAAVAATIK
ncbi:ribosomal protein L7Ae/L30e/S12e/Gadd45 [Alkaliphilus metalliredigens QYMF]|uniref:Ribosomal protein L7Ae/L30e/S12e/Gadd45 n=1 Tax=Alkaliphilus metalliredigens (strain QYMF) TaxID=293826 RepID=A6TWI8_ALKMQ|nr:ribosomal L7Ae/L30e/S12e/Gadd45 family protein [Alkaliphilus metalliredigens]ABR50556.1 ribosomal protein L7Ae/L30e/S12e/Gadd45 [Alkaliphilus metalliredigens QYMF]